MKEAVTRLEVARAALPFAIGTGSLLVVDLVLGSYLEEAAIAEWGFTRSVALIAGAIGVFGIDQALLRQPVEPSKLLSPVAAQAMLSALASGVLVAFLSGPTLGLIVGVAVFGLVTATIYSGYLRSRFMISASVIGLYGWRIVLLVVVLVLVALDQAFVPAAFAASVIAASALAMLLAFRAERARSDADRPAAEYRSLLAAGSRFWATNSVAVAAVYLDQVILEAFGLSDEAAIVFLYTTAIYPLPLLFAGFGANLYNPWLRTTPLIHQIRSRRRVQVLAVTAGMFFGAFSGLVSFALIRWILHRFVEIDRSLLVGLVLIAAARTCYVLPSGVIGIYGRLSQITRLGTAGVVAIASSPLAFAVSRWLGASGEDAVWMGMLLAALVRLGAGLGLARAVLDAPGELSMESR